MTLSRALTVSSLTVIVIISAWLHTAMPRPPTVDAGHDNPASSHLTDLIDFDLAGGRIVQNVIKGDAIPVCSDDLPLSTAAAARTMEHVLRHDGGGLQVERPREPNGLPGW